MSTCPRAVLVCCVLVLACNETERPKPPEEENSSNESIESVQEPVELKPDGVPSLVETHLRQLDQDIERMRSKFLAPKLGTASEAKLLQKRLQEMFDLDQRVRRAMDPPKNASADQVQAIQSEVGRRMAEMDRLHTAELEAFVEENGWPRISKYGRIAAQNAWLLAQHADQSPDFQKKVLALLEKLPANEVEAQHIAYLTDRIASREGEQLYGTQGRCVAKGTWEPNPVKDPKNLDKRRAKIGLEPMEEYKKRFVDSCP